MEKQLEGQSEETMEGQLEGDALKRKELPELLLPWFRANARPLPWREDREPYHVWLSEVMLQQTRVEAVRKYYLRFLTALPDIPSLAAADGETLGKLWEGLGYYSRMRNLQAAARQIVTEYGGVFPRTYAQIRSLAGVGEYTAGAIASICFELPEPAVDGNVLRVLARLTGDRRPINQEKTKAAVREALRGVYPSGACGDFTQALMELGAVVCLPNGSPNCGICPLNRRCFSRSGAWRELPVREERKPRRKEDWTLFLLHQKGTGALALRRRPDKGLLAGLWELPNLPGHLAPEAAAQALSSWGLRPVAPLWERRQTHIFTHVEWDMCCYAFTCSGEGGPELVWFPEEELRERIALPTAFRRFLFYAETSANNSQ